MRYGVRLALVSLITSVSSQRDFHRYYPLIARLLLSGEAIYLGWQEI